MPILLEDGGRPIGEGGVALLGEADPTSGGVVGSGSLLVVGGLLGPYLITGGLGSGATAPVVETFRHALHQYLISDAAIVAMVGPNVFPAALPGGFDLQRHGPALTYTVFKFPMAHGGGHGGHDLSGSDGTVLARVRFSAWSYRYSEADALTVAVFDAVDGLVNAAWGTVRVMMAVHSQELDDALPGVAPKTVIYHIASEYDIRYRIAIPSRP